MIAAPLKRLRFSMSAASVYTCQDFALGSLSWLVCVGLGSLCVVLFGVGLVFVFFAVGVFGVGCGGLLFCLWVGFGGVLFSLGLLSVGLGVLRGGLGCAWIWMG